MSPARPLVWLAALLGLGTAFGLRLPSEAGMPANEGPMEHLVPWAMAGLVACACVLLARRQRAPGWAGCVFLLAFARARALEAPQPNARPCSAQEARELRNEPLVGRWRVRENGRSGWVDPYDGAPALAAHGLLFEPESAAPEEAAPVALLPGSEVVPWPRGPIAPARSRGAGFAAVSRLAADELVRLGPAPRGLVQRALQPLCVALEGLRATLGERAESVEGPESAGLLRALAVGEREGLARERVDLFARTGTSHLLAISGWHVGLFAALVILPFSRAFARTRSGRAGILLRGGLALLFAAVAGGGKPVLRATLALVLAQLASWRPRGPRAPPRRPDALSFLGAAFALECLLDPSGIHTLSLSLSYAATLGLILGTGPLAARLRTASEPWDELELGHPRRVWRILRARIGAGIRSGLAASSSAVLATLPLTWTTFGECAPAGVFLTLLALPPFALASLLAWLASLFPWKALEIPAEGAAHALYGLLELGDLLPGTPLLLPPRPLPLLAAASVLVFLGLRRPRALAAGAFLWGLALLPWRAAAEGLELHALDVGHGSALVLRAPGLPALVFDAGSRDRRALVAEALLPLLAHWEVGRVEVVLSHSDQDHASGLSRLAERVSVEVWLGAGSAQDLVRLPHDGERLDLAPGRLEWKSHCPELTRTLLRGAMEAGNEGSRALEIGWRGARILLLGDAEEEGLAGLELAPGPLRLLLAPHHGSETPALGPLLARCSPAEVWISGSAVPAIARDLDRRGLVWRWTGRDGPLALSLP